jgi:hypothetical protein
MEPTVRKLVAFCRQHHLTVDSVREIGSLPADHVCPPSLPELIDSLLAETDEFWLEAAMEDYADAKDDFGSWWEAGEFVVLDPDGGVLVLKQAKVWRHLVAGILSKVPDREAFQLAAGSRWSEVERVLAGSKGGPKRPFGARWPVCRSQPAFNTRAK